MRLPKELIRIFTINDDSIADWLKDEHETLTREHLHAVYRRIVICRVTASLFTAEEAELLHEQEHDDDLSEGFEAMRLRRADAGVDVGAESMVP